MKGRDIKKDWLGTLGPKGHTTWSEFSGFTFYLINFRLEVEEAGNLEIPIGADPLPAKTNKTKPNKSGSFELKNKKRGRLAKNQKTKKLKNKKKPFQTIIILLQLYTTQKTEVLPHTPTSNS